MGGKFEEEPSAWIGMIGLVETLVSSGCEISSKLALLIIMK